METPDELRTGRAPYGAGAKPTATEADANENIQQLKAEISETRSELQDTVAQIQERLSPTNLKDQATEAVREATVGRVQHMVHQAGDTLGQAGEVTRQAADRVVDEVRTSPVPYALIAIGAAWLLTSKRSQRQWSSSYGEDRSLAARGRGDAYTSFPSSGSTAGYGSTGYGSSEYDSTEYGSTEYGAGSSASIASDAQFARNSRQWGTEATNRARGAATQVRNRFETLLQDNPLVLGIAALATGALVAAALPSTEVENRYLGEARENLVESAREVAQTAVEQVTGDDSPQAT